MLQHLMEEDLFGTDCYTMKRPFQILLRLFSWTRKTQYTGITVPVVTETLESKFLVD